MFRVRPAERPLPNPKAPPQPSPRGGSSNWGPIPTFPKGKEFLLAVFKAVREHSFLLVEMVRMGLIVALPLLVRVRRKASTSSSNSVGVAIPQPRVAGEARYPGYRYIKG